MPQKLHTAVALELCYDSIGIYTHVYIVYTCVGVLFIRGSLII